MNHNTYEKTSHFELSEKDLTLYLQNHAIQQYLENLIQHPEKQNVIQGNLTMALYSGAAKSPRILRYKDAHTIAMALINHVIANPRIFKSELK